MSYERVHITLLGMLWQLAHIEGTQRNCQSLDMMNILNLDEHRHVKVHFPRSL